MSGTNPVSPNSGSSSTGGGGGSAFGRMFRRYSQTNTKTDSQRSSREPTRERISDRDAFTAMTRNISSPSFDPSNLGSMRSPSANGSQQFPRSSSASSNLNDRSSAELAVGLQPTLPHVSESQSPPPQAASASDSMAEATASTPAATRPRNDVHRIRLVPHLEATRSLHFEPIERDMKEGSSPVKVGRFTDRQTSQQDANLTMAAASNQTSADVTIAPDLAPSSRGQPGARGGAIPLSGSNGGGGRIDSSRIAFKSKVVSRGHSELWCEPGGKFFIRDTKSSSGTFLNHIRLSAPNAESRPFAIKDGDVIQLGVDYQGGTEEIYRCVKMRVELNRGWQREANQFNVNALRQLRALQGSPLTPDENGKSSALLPTNRQGVSVTDCCICLFSVTVCQALFIAPCSHVFHYKCIRPLLNLHHPGFSCPLCRTFADLDADVEEDEAWQAALLQEAATAQSLADQGQAPFEIGTPAIELDAPMIAAVGATSPDANDPSRIGVDTNPSRLTSAFSRSASGGVATSPLLADLHASDLPLAAIGRGTAASSQRKMDWAGRTGTAVGITPDSIPEDQVVARQERADLVARLDHEVRALSVADGALDGGRRGSGPIAIGGSRAPRIDTDAVGPHHHDGENDWPSGARMDGFSPSADDNGTPLNSTFLSTLAEPPRTSSDVPARAQNHRIRAPVASADAPRQRYSTHLLHSSDGGDDVDTAEDELRSSDDATSKISNHAAAKGKATLLHAAAPRSTTTATTTSTATTPTGKI